MLSRAEAPAAMSNAPAATPQRPLAGDAGYKRLVRLLGRAFYAGECPPREPEEEMPAGARTIRRDKASRCRQGWLQCRWALPTRACHGLPVMLLFAPACSTHLLSVVLGPHLIVE